jgi:hypothetical protein
MVEDWSEMGAPSQFPNELFTALFSVGAVSLGPGSPGGGYRRVKEVTALAMLPYFIRSEGN